MSDWGPMDRSYFEKINIIFTSVLAAVMAFLQNVFGACTVLFLLVCLVMLADLLTGLYAAWMTEGVAVQSTVIARGLKKKLGNCLLIILGLIMDNGLIILVENIGLDFKIQIMFTALILAWLFLQELISNLENLEKAGIKLPKFLLKALSGAVNQVEQKGRKTDDNSKKFNR